MAQGKRKITLGNNKGDTPNQALESAPDATVADIVAGLTGESTQPMAEQHTLEEDTTIPVAPPISNTTPPNGNGAGAQDETPDEDLIGGGTGVNQRSSIADKRKYFVNEVRKQGRVFAGAAASTLKLAETILEGTVNDAFAYAELPNGMKQDDALEMYKLFRMPNKDSKPVDTASTDFNSNVAKYRNIIFLGMNHKNEAQQWFGDVVDVIEEKTSSPDIRKSMKNLRGTFEFLADVVREQLDRDGKAGGSAQLMDEDEVFNSLLKPTKTFDDDALTALIDAYKKLNLARDGKTPTKSGKGGFPGLKDQQLVDIIQSLQDYAFNDLDPASSARFKASTAKQKRTRRTIKPPVAGAPTTGDAQIDNEEAEAQAQADQE